MPRSSRLQMFTDVFDPFHAQDIPIKILRLPRFTLPSDVRWSSLGTGDGERHLVCSSYVPKRLL